MPDDPSKLGDQPIESRHRQGMISAARMLDTMFNGDKRGHDRDVGFVLIVFPFGNADGRCNYISNGADRHDVVRLMEQQAAGFRAQMRGDSDA